MHSGEKRSREKEKSQMNEEGRRLMLFKKNLKLKNKDQSFICNTHGFSGILVLSTTTNERDC
jgi:hypothetical protein